MKKRLLFILLLLIVTPAMAQVTNYGSTPYCTSFETGTLDANWYTTASNNNGRMQIWDSQTLTWGGNTATAQAGEMWFGMDADPGGTYVTNEAWVGFDMTGVSNQRLKFWWAEWNDETEPEDGVYISDDGGTTFTKVLNLDGAAANDLQWYFYDMSLDSINSVHGLSFTSTYVIKFQQRDNYYFAGGNDGFLFDNVFVGESCMECTGLSEIACDSYTVPSGDETYSAAGVYKDTLANVASCDSIIEINLMLNGGSAAAATISETVCETYTVPSGDETYTSSGSYMDTIPTTQGCDSVLTINLTINSAATSTTTISECDSLTWTDNNTYYTSGTYTQTLTAANGCDSIATLDLTVNATPNVTLSTSDSITFTANGATNYEWIDCNTLTVVASGASFTPSQNGDYAAVGTSNSCTDTTDCISLNSVGLSEYENYGIDVYPNPVKNTLHVQSEDPIQTVTVYDYKGQLIASDSPSSSEWQFSVEELPSGIYMISITTAKGKIIQKIVRE